MLASRLLVRIENKKTQLEALRPLPSIALNRLVERSLDLYLDACTPRTARPDPMDEWLPLRAAAEGTPYSQEYLSLLARMGRMEATKRGKIWYTTQRAIQMYRQSLEK